MSCYDLIIFDCDGVLVDSEPLTNRILAEMMSEAGWPTSTEFWMGHNGKTIKACIELAEKQIGRALPVDFEEKYNQRIHKILANQVQAIPGVRAVLKSLQNEGRAFCVASSAPIAKMKVTLGKTGLWDIFAPNIFSATMVARGKPAPDLFLYAAQKMGVDPSRCMVIEDSPSGAQAAKAASMQCVGYAGNSAAPKDALRGAGAYLIVKMDELLSLL